MTPLFGVRVPETYVVLDARPAELLDPAVLEDPRAVVEEPVAVGLLLDDQAHPEVVEGDRHVEPPHAAPRGVGRAPGRLGLAGRADPPRPVAGADPAIGRHGDVLTVDRDRALPRAALREPLRVQHLLQRAGSHHVRRFLDGREQATPVEVQGDALGLLEDDSDLLQRLGDLDPEVADARVETVVVHRLAEVHGGLLVAAADQDERVLGAEVRVVAGAEDGEEVTRAVVGVEVPAVVEVAVTAADVGHRLRQLVDRVLVQAGDHQAPTFARSRSMSGLQWNSDSTSSGFSTSPKWIDRTPVRMKTTHHWTPL